MSLKYKEIITVNCQSWKGPKYTAIIYYFALVFFHFCFRCRKFKSPVFVENETVQVEELLHVESLLLEAI
jgi:hypothetical protein